MKSILLLRDTRKNPEVTRVPREIMHAASEVLFVRGGAYGLARRHDEDRLQVQALEYLKNDCALGIFRSVLNEPRTERAKAPR